MRTVRVGMLCQYNVKKKACAHFPTLLHFFKIACICVVAEITPRTQKDLKSQCEVEALSSLALKMQKHELCTSSPVTKCALARSHDKSHTELWTHVHHMLPTVTVTSALIMSVLMLFINE